MPKPASSRAERLASFHLDDFPLPTRKQEEWRFAPLEVFAPLFEPNHDGEAITMDVALAPEVTAEVVPADDPRLGLCGAPTDRAAAAGWEASRQAVVITIPAHTTATEPTTATVNGHSRHSGVWRQGRHSPESLAAQAASKLLVIAEPGSRAIVVVDHHGAARFNETIEIAVGEGATLTVVSIQDWAPSAVHVASHRALLAKDASLKHVVATFGGRAVRITPDAVLAEPGAHIESVGLYFADAGQYQEHRLFVDHAAPNCYSRVTYKGALQGEGTHTAWVGDVLIQAQATGTDTYELNRNLVLTKGARADSVPNLEIETGEIAGAGHASATGRFDDEQLFYLMARGIPEAQARELVVHGFFAELISEIGVPQIEQRLLTRIAAELAAGVNTDKEH